MWRTILPYYFLFCLLAVVTDGQSEGEKLSEYFRQKCLQNGRKEEVFNKFHADIAEFNSYFQRVSEMIPREMGVFCGRERAQLSVRINEISNDLKPCLTDNEKFLAGFLNTSINEFVHFLCHKDAKYTKLFFSSGTEQCQETLVTKQESELTPCFNRIFPPRSREITKEEICSNIKIAKECLSRSFDKLCPNANSYQELNNKLFEYISKPCSGCSHYLHTLLLLMSVVISFMSLFKY